MSIILIAFIGILLLVLSWVWPPDSPWAPWWRTNRKTAHTFLKLIDIKKTDVMYELGSGDAMTLITAAKKYGVRCVGIEIDPLRVWISKLLVRLFGVSDKVTILQKNFFDVNLSEATVVYMYLVPKTLKRLHPKLKKELKKGTKIVSFRYKIDLPLLTLVQGEEIFVYEVGAREY